MERRTFCKMMVKAKERAGLRTVDVARMLEKCPNNITRMEHAGVDFNMRMCLQYIHAIGYELRLEGEKHDAIIHRYCDLSRWYTRCRGTNLSMREVGRMIGRADSYVRLLEARKTTMSVDTFLSYASAFNYDIQLQPISKPEDV